MNLLTMPSLWSSLELKLSTGFSFLFAIFVICRVLLPMFLNGCIDNKTDLLSVSLLSVLWCNWEDSNSIYKLDYFFGPTRYQKILYYCHLSVFFSSRLAFSNRGTKWKEGTPA